MFCFNLNDEMCDNFLISFFRKKIDLKKFVSAELRKAVNGPLLLLLTCALSHVRLFSIVFMAQLSAFKSIAHGRTVIMENV